MGRENKGRLFQRDQNQVNGLLDKGCNFEGKLTFDGVVQINGDFRGEIFSDGTLVVGRNAHINAKILVDTMIVDGSVEGNVEAKGKVELHQAGTLVANVVTNSLVIEDGGIFQGSCQMPSLDARQAATTRMVEGEEVFVQGAEDRDTMVM